MSILIVAVLHKPSSISWHDLNFIHKINQQRHRHTWWWYEHRRFNCITARRKQKVPIHRYDVQLSPWPGNFTHFWASTAVIKHVWCTRSRHIYCCKNRSFAVPSMARFIATGPYINTDFSMAIRLRFDSDFELLTTKFSLLLPKILYFIF